MTAFFSVRPHLAGHAAVALRRHREVLLKQGLPAPAGLRELEDSFTFEATEGQRGTPLDDLWQATKASPVPALLMTYEDAAIALSCSVRTVKRLVQAGDLVPVKVGGLTRLSVVAVRDYVATLDTTTSEKESA